jgi:hypothetical protein
MVGQTYHWFNLEQTRPEFQRILTPTGWLVLVWNVQRATGTPFLEALQQFWQTEKYWKRADLQTTRRRKQVLAYRINFELVRKELLALFFRPGAFEETILDNPLACDLEGLIGRVLSNGPALEPGDSMYPAMLASLNELFSTHQEGGVVTIQHDNRVICGHLPP